MSILTAEEALQLAGRLLAARYPNAEAGLAAGSFVRGGATAASDLDIIVLHAALPNAWRESFIFEGVPVDAFIHDPSTLRAFLQKDFEAGKPATLTMVMESRVAGPRPEAADPLKAEATAIYEAGPPPLTQANLDLFRYLISSRVEDIEDERPWHEVLATGVWLHSVLADFILRANGRWASTAKWAPRALKAFDPEMEIAFVEAFNAMFDGRDAQPVIALADRLLAPFGGRLFDGYRAESPPEPKDA